MRGTNLLITSHRRSTLRGALGLCWLLLICCPAMVRSQFDGPADPASDAEDLDDQSPHRPFSLPTQSTEISDHLADYERYVKRGLWDRAFESLEQVIESDPDGMLEGPGGIVLPVGTRIRQLLATLPTPGREAYQLFYDARARQLLSEATGPREQPRLAKVYWAYFATSVGDQAANRLGDLYFEQGSLEQAVDCWNAILEHHPESSIPQVRLLLKTAVARVRGQRSADAERILERIKNRHAGEQVVVGGRTVDAAGWLAELLARTNESTPPVATALSADLKLPVEDDPRWQFRYFDKDVSRRLMLMQMQQWGWGGSRNEFGVPQAATDGKRLYLNLSGYLLALDVKTGKLKWRSGNWQKLENLNNGNRFFRSQDFKLSLASGRLYAIVPGDSDDENALECRRADNGKRVWTSSSKGKLASWNIVGNPYVHGERVFVTATDEEDTTKLHVLAIGAADGKLHWQQHVGTYQVDVENTYYTTTPEPALAIHEDLLLIDTNLGGFAVLSAEDGALQWGLAYEAPMFSENNYYGVSEGIVATCRPVISDGLVYVKGTRSPRLYAVDLSNPTVLWQRPVTASDMLAASAQQRLLMAGTELTCLDRDSRRMLWASKVRFGTPEARPLVTRDRVYAFTPRGVYEVDQTTGDVVRIFRGSDRDSKGGLLLQLPGTLLTISDQAITAYDVNDGKPLSDGNAKSEEKPTTRQLKNDAPSTGKPPRP